MDHNCHVLRFSFHCSYKLRLRRVRLQGRWQGGRLLRRGPHPRLQPQPHPQDHRGDRRPGREGEEDAEQGKALTSKISILTSFSSFIPPFVHLLLAIIGHLSPGRRVPHVQGVQGLQGPRRLPRLR